MKSPSARTTCLLFSFCVALIASAAAQNSLMLPVMPMPAKVQPGQGRFLINESFSVRFNGHKDPRLVRASLRFLNQVSQRTGIVLRSVSDSPNGTFVLHCDGPGQQNVTLGEDESYRLQVTPSEVRLDAPNSLGLMRGMQTYLQLIQPDKDGFAVPAMAIEDSPRFPWRGLLIDVARHFIPVDVLKRNLDGMEAVKFNVLHWHLSDDQGFRVESKKLPKLQQFSSDGNYYTQAEIRDVIEYAHDRGIRVVPEFDMPGHTTSWFASYPDLASAPGPYQIERKWGVFDPAMDPSRESTYAFLDIFIGEMAGLFPDAYFHIGGDEVNGKQWNKNTSIQAFMRKRGFKTNGDLQAYFNQRLEEIVKKHGKLMDGWDEILHPDLPTDTVVQSWRGQKSLAEAARSGYAGLLSHGYYLDLMYPASRHYSPDPLEDEAASLTPQQKARILGGEACMWAEFITAANIDNRIWPRAAAVAERLWSPQDVKDPDDMYRRLEILSTYLDSVGLTHNVYYRQTLRRLAGGNDVPALQTLTDVLEPVKGYTRERTHEYERTTPLDRLVDALHPESDAARHFSGIVDRYLQNPGSDATPLQNQLTVWRDNDRVLAPFLQSNARLQEVLPLSQNLAAVSAAGLQAVDYLKAGGRAPAAWRDSQLNLLKQAEKPQGEMLNMVVPSVRKLVEATTPK